jgi:hypothetical protein
MAHHVLGDDHIVVDLAIVDLELEAHEVGQDGCGSCLCSDRHNLLSRLWSDNWESGGMGSVRVGSSGMGKWISTMSQWEVLLTGQYAALLRVRVSCFATVTGGDWLYLSTWTA